MRLIDHYIFEDSIDTSGGENITYFTGTDNRQYPLKKPLDVGFWDYVYRRVMGIIDKPLRTKEFRREMNKLYSFMNKYSDKVYPLHPNFQPFKKALEEFKEKGVGSAAGNYLRFMGNAVLSPVEGLTGKDIVSNRGIPPETFYGKMLNVVDDVRTVGLMAIGGLSLPRGDNRGDVTPEDQPVDIFGNNEDQQLAGISGNTIGYIIAGVILLLLLGTIILKKK